MTLRIHDDNPSVVDLLGFDAVVVPMVEAIKRPDTGPLTIGIRGGWGTGKSTLLQLVQEALIEAEQQGDREYLVIAVDPWEFENAGELRSTLIEMVLTELRGRVPDGATVGVKLRRLIARVRFGKIAAAALKGLATMPLDGGWSMLGRLVKGLAGGENDFVASAEEEPELLPATMHGFRSEFGALIETLHAEMKIAKVVVLVDDLDRCLPDAVVESLEAIKLFLAVDRMVFVIAADEALVRSAIGVSLAGSGRASDFADRYLEKIVQLPLTIPALADDDAITYATLLLSSADEAFEALCIHCRDRRWKHQIPLLDEAPHTEETIERQRLATQICDGLGTERKVNPRQIKRFLNSFAVRASIASARGIDLSPSVMAKLMLLEEQYLATDFRTLVETPGPDVRELLRGWEAWARNDDGAELPNGLTEGSRRWASSAPSLGDTQEDIPAYLALAAALTAARPGGLLTGRVARVVEALLAAESNDAARSEVLGTDMPDLDDAEAEQVLTAISQRAIGLTNRGYAVRVLVEAAEKRESLEGPAAKLIEERLAPCVTLEVSARLTTTSVAAIKELARRLVNDPRVPEEARTGLAAALSPKR